MPTLLPSVAGLLAGLAPCFTALTFQTFTALACEFLAQTGPRTVTGMLLGARLSRGDRLPELIVIAGLTPPVGSARSCPATAAPTLSSWPGCAACGQGCSALSRSRSCWYAHPARPTATTWRWPPPTWTHPLPSLGMTPLSTSRPTAGIQVHDPEEVVVYRRTLDRLRGAAVTAGPRQSRKMPVSSD